MRERFVALLVTGGMVLATVVVGVLVGGAAPARAATSTSRGPRVITGIPISRTWWTTR